MTVLKKREVLSCPLYKKLSSHFVPIVEFRRFPLMNIRVLRKADEPMELQAFHRVIALLRTDRDHEQHSCLHVYLHGQYRDRVSGPSQSIHFI